ncbi:MAG: hypothetical protein ABSA65_02385 [Acidimicrobiales bacterium]|jgi:hypothetical protein
MMTEGEVMPKYVVVARIIIRSTNAFSESGFPLTERVPGTWHLAEVDGNGRLSGAHACGSSAAQVEVRHPVREWKVLDPWCPDCEVQAGDAAREQAAHEAERSYTRL